VKIQDAKILQKFAICAPSHNTNQFSMKWKKNEFGGRKVIGQATVLLLDKKVGEQLPALSNRLCHQ